MKIAVIISGEPRFSSQLDSFIESLKYADQIDWFFYLWDHTTVKYTKLQVPLSWKDIISKEWALTTIKTHFPSNHNIIDVQIENQNIVPPMFNSEHVLFKQFYSLNQVDILRQQHGPYDLVIRGRIDLSIPTTFDLNTIKTLIDQNPKLIFTPINNRHGLYDLNDQLAISSPENISIYTSLINYINQYKSQGIIEHPETLLGHHLISNNLEIRRDLLVGELRDPNNTEGFGKWN